MILTPAASVVQRSMSRSRCPGHDVQVKHCNSLLSFAPELYNGVANPAIPPAREPRTGRAVTDPSVIVGMASSFQVSFF
jgi:hypothetical protein